MRDKLGEQVRDLELALQRAKAAGTYTSSIERSLSEARAERDLWKDAEAFTGTEEERMSLSGMSNEEAQAVMDAVPQGKRTAYEALAKKVDAINAETRQASVRYGLVTSQQAQEWERLYKHYVPLHRDEAHPQSRLRMGQGFSIKGKESQMRTGSQARVTNILAHIAAQREQTITRGEKNHVAKKLWLLAAQNPVPGFWSLEPPKASHVDNETGLVVRGADPAYKNKPNVLMVKIGGDEHAIVFDERNERAMRLAGELKNLDAPTLDGVSRYAAMMTRWFASVNTQYNPVFGVINFTRDVQAAGLQLSTTKLNGHRREVMQATIPALRAVWRAERGGAPANAQQEALMRQWKELQQAGGMTGYRDVFSQIEDRAKALDKMLAENDRGKVAAMANKGLDLLSDYNQAMEGATRLAAYQQARKLGLSVNESASIAKNLTVNFNRKGAWARSAAPWYAFFNAAMQGNARLFETLSGPMGKKIMFGGVLLGMAASMVSMMLMGGGDDDPDKQTPWQKIPDFVKERSLVLGWGEDYIAIPMPLGYNIFTNAGRLLAEQLLGHGKPGWGGGWGRAAVDALGMAVGAFNPVGGGDVVSAVTPTPVDWAIDLLRNKDWTGKAIYREDINGLDATPGHSRAKDSATPWAKALSRGVNWVTGGTEYTPGKWSPTPDQIDYVIGQLTGGVGREIGKLATTLASPFTADELPANKIPLISRVYGNTKSPQAGSELFYENVKNANELEREIAGRKQNDQPLSGIPPYAFDLVRMGHAAESQVRKLRAIRRHEMQSAKDGYKDRVDAINTKIGSVMDDFNRNVNRAKRLESATQ